ncbi:MAG: tRNA uridine-5-carboxymethylaminomethyl(34) synthesis GTPase MnmE [Lachnospiraceae bacterium]|nr:tRNA uridine-5-carboxymethylaminomethyl(34) synthesis GTPase MnmE [Lachnospiraceae bacterium]
MRTDTIAAIATGNNSSGISIIRLSGSEAISVADRIFVSKQHKHILSVVKTHTIHYGYIIQPDKEETEKERILDEVLVSVMRAPNSYTTEDVVEINCHGGIVITNMILEQVLLSGARLAEPGEFTKRAFLNGRIDLSEAEAVMELIDAGSRAAAMNSERMLSGSLSKIVERLRESILFETAFIESALDDPEHFDLSGYPEKLSEKIKELLDEIEALLQSAEDGELIKNGIRTVILGKPNVGKSTFLNLIAGAEKAIVTEIAGTTRDVLSQNLSIRGIEFVFMDTAGIRNTEDVVEKIGVDKAKQAAQDADLILYIADSAAGFDEEDEKILAPLSDKKIIVLMNKSDLLAKPDTKSFDRIGKSYQVLSVSAKENTGIREFKDLVESMFFQNRLQSDDQIYLTNIRHKEALADTKNALLHVMESIDAGMTEDFYAIDLMDAYTSLGRILGKELGDDLVEEIFSKFCLGK